MQGGQGVAGELGLCGMRKCVVWTLDNFRLTSDGKYSIPQIVKLFGPRVARVLRFLFYFGKKTQNTYTLTHSQNFLSLASTSVSQNPMTVNCN